MDHKPSTFKVSGKSSAQASCRASPPAMPQCSERKIKIEKQSDGKDTQNSKALERNPICQNETASEPINKNENLHAKDLLILELKENLSKAIEINNVSEEKDKTILALQAKLTEMEKVINILITKTNRNKTELTERNNQIAELRERVKQSDHYLRSVLDCIESYKEGVNNYTEEKAEQIYALEERNKVLEIQLKKAKTITDIIATELRIVVLQLALVIFF